MAATGASNSYSVSGGTWTFSITTKSDWGKWGSESITFGQTKGVREIPVWKGFPPKLTYKYKNEYTTLNITATPNNGGATKKATLSGSSTTLNLDRDKNYTVTVKWMDLVPNTIDQVSNGTWSTYPTWNIKSTNKCTYTTP